MALPANMWTSDHIPLDDPDKDTRRLLKVCFSAQNSDPVT
jgi:hypothetical protein